MSRRSDALSGTCLGWMKKYSINVPKWPALSPWLFFVCHLCYFVCSAEVLRHAADVSFVPEGPGSSLSYETPLNPLQMVLLLFIAIIKALWGILLRNPPL